MLFGILIDTVCCLNNNNNNKNNNKKTQDPTVASAETRWSSLSGSVQLASEEQHIQKAWDKPVTGNHQALVFSRASDDVEKARLSAAALCWWA